MNSCACALQYCMSPASSSPASLRFCTDTRPPARPHLLCRLPLGQLAEALLPGPHAGVDDLEEQLPRARVEDEDGAVDGLGGQVALKRLVDRYPVCV